MESTTVCTGFATAEKLWRMSELLCIALVLESEGFTAAVLVLNTYLISSMIEHDLISD
jgi:hypothetical protein